jgi:hypothetical protein
MVVVVSEPSCMQTVSQHSLAVVGPHPVIIEYPLSSNEQAPHVDVPLDLADSEGDQQSYRKTNNNISGQAIMQETDSDDNKATNVESHTILGERK